MTWEKKKITNLCNRVLSGGTPKSSEDSYYRDGTIPWLRTQEVVFNRIYETEIRITENGFQNSNVKWVKENSIIVAMYGNSAGRIAITKIPITTNQACCNLEVNSRQADYNFLFYNLLEKYEVIKSLAKGAAQNNLNANDIKEFEVTIPPLPTQHRIAYILSAYDDLIENNLKRIRLLEEMALLKYKQLISEKDLARKKLFDILDLKYGKALKADDRREGKYPVYGSSGVVGNHDEFYIEGPGIVVGRKGNVGSVYWSDEKFWPIDTVYYVESDLSYYFLYFNLKEQYFVNTDAAVPGLNRTCALDNWIDLPPYETIIEFENEVIPIFKIMSLLNKQNTKLIEARDILLPRLMSGEIEV